MKRKVQGAAQTRDQGIAFLSFAMETLGGFRRVALEPAERIGVIEQWLAIKALRTMCI